MDPESEELEYTHASSQKDMNQVFDLCAKIIGPNYYEAYDLFSATQRYDMRSRPQKWRIARTTGGDVIAHVGSSLKDIRIGKATLSAGCLRDVAIRPDFITRTPTARLIHDAVEYLKNEKIDVIMVYGSDYDYQEFGFIGVLPEYRFFIPASEAEHIQRKFKFMSFDLKQVKRLTDLHQMTYAPVPSHVIRDEASFLADLKRHKILENTRKYSVHTFGAETDIGAYIVLNKDSILEACASDATGWETLVSYLCDRATANRREDVDLSGLSFSHPLIKYCRRYRHRAETLLRLQGGGLAKVISVQRCLEKMLPEFKVRMDASGYKNSGFICVNFEVGKEKVGLIFDGNQTRLEYASPKSTLTIASSESGFAQMLFGTLAVDEIADIRLEGAVFLASILFPKDYPQIPTLDRF
jgi:hypothetical protein